MRTYDVFDADGHFREVVRLGCDLDREQDRLQRLDDGRWIFLRNIAGALRSMFAAYREETDAEEDEEEAEPLEIVCLRAAAD